MGKILLTTKETAEYLGITPQEVRRLHQEKHLPSMKGFNNPTRYSIYAINQYLDKQSDTEPPRGCLFLTTKETAKYLDISEKEVLRLYKQRCFKRVRGFYNPFKFELEDDKYKVINKPEIKVLYHLGMFTGQRLKDCVLLRWDKVDLNKKRIWVKQFKTGKEVTIPMAPKLFEVLTEAKSWKTDHYLCPNSAMRYKRLDKNGKNIGSNLVGVDVLRVIRWIGLETSVSVPGRKRKVTVYGFHSLRHSFASHCAEAGVPKAVVLSILGTNSKIVDKHYTHIGEEAQEKAIQSLFGDDNSISERERIEKVLSIIDTVEDKSNIVLEIEKALRT